MKYLVFGAAFANIVSMLKRYRNFYMVYCIGSGFAALMLVLNSAVHLINKIINISINGQDANEFSILMYIFALGISVYGIFCGVKIANNSPNSKKYLRYYLIPQIPLISIPGFIYFLKLGLDLTIYFALDFTVSSIIETRMNFAIGSFFNLNFDTSITNKAVYVGINIVPVILLISLMDTKKLSRRKKSKKQD